ncbi:Bacterial SH3 domain protein [Brevundimonas sp. SH203]|uniref:SH3 domain-containing protein n=1 Tax=Brevundimonas sp. SH203 TaxID=345167 RepID=UPI0009C9CEFA|nr:SH3 domain-containing protein [Brevundimonas sp. SH203]GAW42257.1 Bacterial SH3 domain protein [Brevundimonas sp. SH203]
MRFGPIALVAGLCLLTGFAQPARAASIDGYSVGNLNIRSGPSVRFPPVGVLGAGTVMTVHGCVSHYRWCDVSASGVRGWAPGGQIQIVDEERGVYLPSRAGAMQIPLITFQIESYWRDHYRDYDFYGDYDDWDHYQWEDDGPPPGWHDAWDD